MRALASLMLLAATPALAETPPPPPAPAATLYGAAINVVDLQREVEFYTNGLGMKIGMKLPLGPTRTETILTFGSDPSQPTILLMHDTGPNAPRKIEHGNNFSRLVIRVADIRALAARLTALGYAHDEVRTSHGYHIMMLNDPEGFRIELIQQAAQPQGSQ